MPRLIINAEFQARVVDALARRVAALSIAFAMCIVSCTAARAEPPSAVAPNREAEQDAAEKEDDESERQRLLELFVSELVQVTPGNGKFPRSFRMGSDDGPENERPSRKVTMGEPFWIARYEVPQNLYEAVMGGNPSRWRGPRNSVEMVTWKDASKFCEQLTRLLVDSKLISPDEEIRLPSEAEWEYCCRAGTSSAYSFGESATVSGDRGNQATVLDRYAWHTGNAAGNDPPVGALEPNPWGLYDMHGYLWEYVADAWHPNYAHAPSDARAWQGDGKRVERVVRGGSWRDRFDRLQSTSRMSLPNHARSDAIGFRCVKARLVQPAAVNGGDSNGFR